MDDVTRKVLAETWRERNDAGGNSSVYCATYRGDAPVPPPEHVGYVFYGIVPAGAPGFEETEARARIAACAPELARLILEAEWAGGHFDGSAQCPWCGAEQGTAPHGPHEADCSFVTLCVKAGLR